MVIKLKNITKSFGEIQIHRGISFTLSKGETIGLLGSSGSGKSALLRSIIGLNQIDSGEIYFHDTRIDHLHENDLTYFRTKISYSFQNGALFDSLTVFDNIAYPLYEHTKLSNHEIKFKVNEMLELVGLPDKGQVMPNDLSGGMQKRVGMARSMILMPEVILYDEPTAGLDPANTTNVVGLMNKLKQTGISAIFVTHDIPAAMSLCDRILFLHQGLIYYSGTPKEFYQSTDNIIKQFLSLNVATGVGVDVSVGVGL